MWRLFATKQPEFKQALKTAHLAKSPMGLSAKPFLRTDRASQLRSLLREQCFVPGLNLSESVKQFARRDEEFNSFLQDFRRADEPKWRSLMDVEKPADFRDFAKDFEKTPQQKLDELHMHEQMRKKHIVKEYHSTLKTKEDKAVRAIHFRPGNKKIVHHALCYVDSSGIARKLDAEDDGPGYASAKGGIGFLPTGSLGGWAPGVLPRFVPEGTGRYLARGADLVLQMHYHPSGKEESDVSEVGIYYCKETPKKYLAGFGVENWTIAMPAGEARYELNAEYKLTVPVTLIGTAPHMHLLGKSLKSWAETPDGKTIPLIEVKHWDFNWQDFYLYRKPIDLPKGTIVKMESVHDNSSSNPANPNNPPKPIKWGEGTADEMSLVLFEVTTPTMLDMYGLIADNIRQNKILERFTEPPKPKKK